MKQFWQKIAAGLITAGLTANVVLLWQFNTRLTRIEARLGISAQVGSGQLQAKVNPTYE